MQNQENQDFQEDNIENNESVRAHYSTLPRSQKIAVAVLAFFAVFVLIVWSMQIRDNIFSPFDRSKNYSKQAQNEQCTGPECAANQELASDLMNQDTDSDGLTDWEELTIYKTSPYLEDSDSDGINDKEEIEQGENPLCKKGDICDTGAKVSESETGEEPAGAANTRLIPGLSESEVPAGESDEEALLRAILEGQSDAATLRGLLIQAGMDERILNQLSDEELLNSYQQVLEQ